MEELKTSLMSESSVALTSSYQVLEERRISEKYFMVMIQQIQQYSGTAICQQLTSNPGPLLPKPHFFSDFMGRLNHYAIDNGDVEVKP